MSTDPEFLAELETQLGDLTRTVKAQALDNVVKYLDSVQMLLAMEDKTYDELTEWKQGELRGRQRAVEHLLGLLTTQIEQYENGKEGGLF